VNFPFVAFGRANPDWDFAYVDVDGRTGVRMATEHLLQQGHRQIGLLSWPEGSRVGTARRNGYFEAMQCAGISVNPAWVQHGEGDFETGFRYTHALLQLPAAQRPTAVVAVDDNLALGAIAAAQAAGLTVGKQFGVTGFDDTPGIQHFSPPLTSVRQPIRQVGQAIVGLLINLIQDKRPPTSQINLPPRLIVRASSVRIDGSEAPKNVD
ncbi:MAG: substrate-binding domain-containing protein, partial [Chloroflexota bacterium]|nr:substrate-binding domain-containing protein [Chloroflexota bacterium]